jgi:GNAT superfamily N-acetyltransferase
MKLQILEAKQEDLPRLAPLFDAYRVFYGRTSNAYAAQLFLTERLKRNDSKIFVAIDLESFQTIGFTQLYPSFSSVRLGRIWILEDLFVRGDMRRGGVASSLIDAAVHFAKDSHAVGLTLSTANTNAAAQALYAKRGWQHDDEFQVWNRWLDT